MTFAFTNKLDFYVQKIDIKAQKINWLIFIIFKIVMEDFYFWMIQKRFDFLKKCFC